MKTFLNQEALTALHNMGIHLVSVPVVRTWSGLPTEKIKAEAECGRVLWIFNFSFNGKSPEPGFGSMRFWVRELGEPEAVKNFTIDQVEREILGTTKAWFEPGDVLRRFSISKPDLMRMRRQYGWPLEAISRRNLATMLQSRWTGAIQGRRAAA